MTIEKKLLSELSLYKNEYLVFDNMTFFDQYTISRAKPMLKNLFNKGAK